MKCGKMAKGGDTKLKKLFKGKDSYGEEVKEAKAIKSGKITPKEYAQGEEMEKKMKKGGKCMAKGGVTRGDGVVSKGHTKGKNLGDSGKSEGIQSGAKRYAKGGVTRADGVVSKGHTKGKFV